ncbi:MAG: DUF881 domain-containing protein [Bacillota bacterium]|jgi:uncharacterized protein YlxW (UPF0749 family)
MKNFWDKHMLVFAIVACITGFVLMISFRSYTPISASDNDTRHKAIIAYIKKLEDETSALEEQIMAARAEIESLQKTQTEGADILLDLQTMIEPLNIKAGYTAMTGAGLILTLDDNTAGAALAEKNNSAYNPEEYIIHDKNILYLTRSIANVADAISINGQRLVDSSNIRCVGTVIMVNSSRLAPPYEIKIIGDAEKITSAILSSDEYLNLKANNMPIKISPEENIEIPAFSGSNTPTYTKISD